MALTNPLLSEAIVDGIFGYMNITDLKACFNVCQLWRSLTPSHAFRLQSTRPPIQIIDDMSDTFGRAYLTSIHLHPCFKATRFSFMDTNLYSFKVKKFLMMNGPEIEELELCYKSLGQHPGPNAPYPKLGDDPQIPLGDLLMHKTPNLKTLIITELPPNRIPINIFPYPSAHGLQLTKIKISLCYVERGQGYSVLQLAGLFCQCMQLEEITITDWSIRDDGSNIFSALSRTNRLKQIKKLRIDHVNSKLLVLLNSVLVAGQLRHFTVKTSDDSDGDGYHDHLEQLLAQQRNSLEYVQIPVNRTHLVLPRMPNLLELRISKAVPPQGPFAIDAPAVGSINYAVHFPKLRVLGFHGSLLHYERGEIYPDGIVPSQIVEVLQEIPRGVDQALMGRIGRMFPNLTIVRTTIPYQNEHLLISVWEFCTNLTDLFLTLDEDYTRWKTIDGREREGLDSLFSGIAEPQCKRLRGLLTNKDEEHEMATLDWGELRAHMPNISNLTKLRRLCIDGPGEMLRSPGVGHREDKFSNVFGYFAAEFLPTTIQFVQIQLGLIKLSSPCINNICNRTGLSRVVFGNCGFDRRCGRLIRPGQKLERLESVPMEWYGLNTD